ncbi:MAG: hypothetical protein IKJ70_02155 [Clostridia bacterium]|nr:hypothetical protein [Clostridia bacterium]
MAAEYAYNYDYGSPAVRENQAAPKREAQKRPEFKKYNSPLAERLAEERAATRKLLKIAAFLSAVIVVFAFAVNSFYQRDSAKRLLTEAENNYMLCQSENKELHAKLTALASAENIDRYAVEKLGLVKVTADKEVYLTAETGNKTIYFQGEADVKK